MEQLSSCYFCGSALDAQIEPYRVIPPQLNPTADQQRAVSLCPTCREKLGHVVESVVAAAGAAPTASAADDVANPEPTGDLLEAETAGDTADAADTGPNRMIDDQPAADSASDAQGDDADGGDTERSTGEPAAGDRQTDASDDETEREAVGTIEQTQSADPEPTSQRHGTADETTGGAVDRSSDPLSTDDSAPSQQSSGDASGQQPTSDASSQQSSTTADAETAADDGPSLTALEYNKVMRLLQNREFPVERAEIHEIATSAYQISDREFDAIIDAAIQRGLLNEENGQLVSGD